MLPDPAKHVLDYTLAAILFVAAKLLHHIPETLAALLVMVRIIVGFQELAINRRKLRGGGK